MLVAVEAGESPDAVAEAFRLGRSSVYRWMAARDEGGRAPKPMAGGPKPIIRDEIAVALCRLLDHLHNIRLAVPAIAASCSGQPTAKAELTL
ncbi:MAG: hypothetical protein ACJ8AI_29850 [Rhodopila sp.]